MSSEFDIEITPNPAEPTEPTTNNCSLLTSSEDEADFVLFAPQFQLKRAIKHNSNAKQSMTFAEWLFSL